VFGTATSNRQHATNVRNRILAKAVERANDRLLAAGEAELPKLTPHALRRTFASVLYAIGDDPGIVMDELGHEDAELALTVYRQSMRRDDGEKDRLKALVNGESFGSFGSDAEIEPATEPMERTA
jgi:integrase